MKVFHAAAATIAAIGLGAGGTTLLKTWITSEMEKRDSRMHAEYQQEMTYLKEAQALTHENVAMLANQRNQKTDDTKTNLLMSEENQI